MLEYSGFLGKRLSDGRVSGESPFLVESQPANERELHLLIGLIRIPDFGSSSQFARSLLKYYFVFLFR